MIRSAEKRFAAVARAGAGTLVPRAKDSGAPPVAYEDLLALARRRRSVRRFDGTGVARHVLDRAVDVAAQSPSACNRQAFEFRIFDDPAWVSELVSIAPGYEPGDAPPPCMVVLVGKYRAYYRERDQHVIYIDASLAAMAFLLALESQGLASCCINWPSIRALDLRMSELLGLDPDEEVIMLMAVGHPAQDAVSPYSQKAPRDELRSYNPR